MNKNLNQLWQQSKLTKSEFARRCDIPRQRLNEVLSGKPILKKETFEKYKRNYDDNGKQ